MSNAILVSAPANPIILLLGSSGTGKSTFVMGRFDPAYRPTTHACAKRVIADRPALIVELGGTQRYTTGYDRPITLCSTLHGSAPAGVLVFYDVTSAASRREAEYYAERVAAEGHSIPVCFVGNKCDLRMSGQAATRLPRARPGSTTLHCIVSTKTGVGMEMLGIVVETMLTPRLDAAGTETETESSA